MSSRDVAKKLTELGIKPPRGGPWSHLTVIRMLSRLGIGGAA